MARAFPLALLAVFVTLTSATPNLLELAESLNLTTFVKHMRESGMAGLITHEGHYTIMAPSNEAFAKEEYYPGEATLREKLQFHIGRGRHMSADIKDEAVIKTMLSKRTIRFNVYSNGAHTANGRSIESVDHEARNGIIHIISDVMSSVYKRAGSVISELDECCPQHSDFIDLVKDSEAMKTLNDEGPFTLLAPTNGAFDALHPDFINHLKKNATAVKALIYGHVIPKTWYSPGLTSGMQLKTLRGNKVTVGMNNGAVTFDKAALTLADVTAGNGAVHAIDAVLFPVKNDLDLDSSRFDLKTDLRDRVTLTEVCEKMGFTSFAAALRKTHLDQVTSQGGTFTVFAPTNEAFDHPQTYPVTFDLVDKVRFHIGRGIIKPQSIKQGQKMATLLSGRRIVFNIYGSEDKKNKIVTANGRKVTFSDKNQAANGYVYAMEDEAMDYVYERKATIFSELARIPRFSLFAKYVMQNGLLGPLTSRDFDFTVLVPNNDVFQKLMETSNPSKLFAQVGLDNVIPDTWYTLGMKTEGHVMSLSGKTIKVTKGKDGKVVLNDSVTIVTPDFTTSHGVFHEVDGLL